MPDEFESQDKFGSNEDSVSPIESEQSSIAPIRVITPRANQVIGKVEQRAGANRMIIACFDGKTRNCRVPGRLKRKLWIRPGNIVLVEPWEFEKDTKGDVIYTYSPSAVQWLERKGFLKGISDEF